MCFVVMLLCQSAVLETTDHGILIDGQWVCFPGAALLYLSNKQCCISTGDHDFSTTVVICCVTQKLNHSSDITLTLKYATSWPPHMLMMFPYIWQKRLHDLLCANRRYYIV